LLDGIFAKDKLSCSPLGFCHIISNSVAHEPETRLADLSILVFIKAHGQSASTSRRSPSNAL
jgi:hypothetical protein